MPTPVIEAILGHLDLEAKIGGYEAADEAAPAIEAAYESVATLLGTTPDRVAFTEHATASFVAALSAILFGKLCLGFLGLGLGRGRLFLGLASFRR